MVRHTTLPVEVDVDVMMAMAAKIHVQAAPVITAVNLEYLKPFFSFKPRVEAFVDEDFRRTEQEKSAQRP